METITTVKITTKTKASLDEFKSGRETYDEVISQLIQQSHDKSLKKRLIEGYKQMAERDRKLVNDWEVTSQEV